MGAKEPGFEWEKGPRGGVKEGAVAVAEEEGADPKATACENEDEDDNDGGTKKKMGEGAEGSENEDPRD